MAKFILLLLLSLPLPAAAQQTDNPLLRALPVPGRATIDGRLDDWDLSAGIESCYDLATLADRHRVDSYLMYDADYLYAAFHFRDATPLVNHVDPRQQPGSGWRSDCVQMRLWTDRVLHVDCYYYTDEKRPTCHILYQDLARRGEPEDKIAEAVGQGVDAAFRADEDGKGYVQEMRLAWRLLRRDGKSYRAGESFRCGLEFFWGDPTAERWPAHRFADLINPDRPQRQFFWSSKEAWGEVRLLDRGRLAPEPRPAALRPGEQLDRLRHDTQGPVAIAYDLPEDGFVTLVIQRPDGSRVRNLIADYPRRQGHNVDYWDGTDDTGRLVEPGQYAVRGLRHGRLDLQYQFTYGTPGTPPWETADGRGDWLADHVPPVGAASDGEWTYLSCFMSEGGSTVIGLDESGQKRWGLGRIGGGLLACEGPYLYMLAGGGHPDWPVSGSVRLLRIDARAGKLAPWPGGPGRPDAKAEHLLASFPDDRPLPARQWEGTLVAQKGFDVAWCQREALGLAAAGGKLFVSLYYENKVLVIDAAVGEVTGEIPVEHPAGLAADAAGHVYALSGKQVLRIAPGPPAAIVSAGLDGPVGLTAHGDRLYVSDWGGAMCVKTFSTAGKPLGTIGRPGGRSLAGPYQPDGMFRPWGLAVDGRGRLWAAEYDFTPKRVSVWGADGRLVREYCGPTWYSATECNVDRLDPRQAFCLGNTVELDWTAGRWRVTGTLWRPTSTDAILGPYGEGLVLETMELAGRKLVVASSAGPYLCIAELTGGGARPLMALGGVGVLCRRGPLPEVFAAKLWDDPASLAWAREKYPAVFTGLGAHRQRDFGELKGAAERRHKPVRTEFQWTDANGDGLVQADELRLFAPEELGGLTCGPGWRAAYGPDLTLYPAAGVEHRTKVWRLPLGGWNGCGAPTYDLAAAKLIYNEKPLYFLNSAWADSRGNVLLNQDPLVMIAPDGRRLWSYPNTWPGVHGSHSAPKDRRGLLIGPLKVIGSVELEHEVGETLCMNGNMGKAFFFTTDGLYVGTLFRDQRAAPESRPEQPQRGVSLAETSPGGEWFGGEFFRHRGDGRIYLGSAARNGSMLSEVTGLDTVRRLPPQTIRFDAKQYQAAEELLAQRAAAAEAPKSLVIVPRSKPVASPPKENDVSWSKEQAARWAYDERRSAEAAWTFDARKLYLVFREVRDETPMINQGQVETQLFKTGDAVLLELRTQPDNDRPEILPGDLRLLVSVFQDRPIAVLYRYRTPGGAAGPPQEFASPVSSTKIDEVRVLSAAQVAIDRQESSYTVRLAVPLSELGFQPQPGKTYRGDLGVIYSDRHGQNNELRMHWANQATGIVSDLAAEAGIDPRRWGRFQVKEKAP